MEVNAYSNLFGPGQWHSGVDVSAIVVSALGLVLNGLLMLVTLRRACTSLDWVLILLISIADLVCSGFLCTYTIVRLMSGTPLAGSVWCDVGSVVNLAALLVGLFLAGQLALVRCSVIVFGRRINQTKFYLLISVVCGSVVGMYAVRGMTSIMVPLPSGLFCTAQYWGKDRFGKAFGIFNMGLFLGSFVLVIASYACIAIHYYLILTLCGIRGWRLCQPILGLMGIIFMYCVAIIPDLSLFIYLRTPNAIRTSLLDGIAILLISCLPAINAIFTLVLHDESRSSVLRMLDFKSSASSPYRSDHSQTTFDPLCS